LNRRYDLRVNCTPQSFSKFFLTNLLDGIRIVAVVKLGKARLAQLMRQEKTKRPKQMKTGRRIGTIVCVFAAIAALSFFGRVHAATYVFNFDIPFSGVPPSSGMKPWIVAVLDDLSGGGVRLSVTNLNLATTEGVLRLFFNLNPVLDPANLTFTFVGPSGAFETPTITKGKDALMADADGIYDIRFDFADIETGWRAFSGGEYCIYDITGLPGLSAADFCYPSLPSGPTGQYLAAARFDYSIGLYGWIGVAVPEPGVVSLAVFGLLILAGRKLF